MIDCFATDHAPHLLSEKDGASPPPGFPGLESALPLLLTAVHEGKLELDDVIERMHTNPMRIFGIRSDDSTYVEVDPDARWQLSAAHMFSKAAWTPFEGREVAGRVERVVLRGTEVFADGQVTAEPGTGRDIRTEEEHDE